MTVLLYIAAIVAANVVTARTAPAEVGPFLITWGTWAVAVTFVLRDLIQVRWGRGTAYAAIGLALAASAVASASLGDTLAVVVASALAFGVSESLDTEVFTRMRGGMPERVAMSGTVGGLFDTAIFVVVGLSPLWSGIIPWSAVPNAVIGVFFAKLVLQFVGAALWWELAGREVEATS